MDRSNGSDITLGAILRDLRPTPSAYLSAARQIEEGTFEELNPVRISILATFTSDLLRPYLVVECASKGLLAIPYFAPYNQLEQQALDSSSALHAFKPDVVVIATRIEETAPNLVTRFVTLSPTDVEDELAQVEERLQGLVEGLRRTTVATLLVSNYASPPFLATGMADASSVLSQASVIQRANNRVAEVCQKFAGAYVFDYARMVSEFGLLRWFDPKLWYFGRIPFGAEAQLETGRRLARYLSAVSSPPCKCLVVDVDNTLWGGVVGEEGIGGITLSEDYPGNMYKDFQRRLLSLRDRGVLLAIASKNNESDVLEVFQKHSDCVLKAEDFAATQIHWQDKAASLAAISEELNISTDALAFFDDSLVERGWIRSQMPEVTVIEVPESPLGFATALEESGAFDYLMISAEDRKRPGLYQKEGERKRLQARSVSMGEFLRQLDMEATVGHVSTETLPRVAQLLAKTNQFNLTNRRHTSSELQAMIEGGAIALWLRVADRFGDNGLVGVAIATPGSSGRWLIDTFLLSCRVVGRGVETALLSILSRMVREKGGEIALGEYIGTPKNGMASEFYPSHGFEAVDGDALLWKRDISNGELAMPDFMKVTFEDEPIPRR